MSLRHILCAALVLAVFAEVTLGQYVGRERGRRCPPRCTLHCPYGFQIDSRGCELCSCNPALDGGIGTFPQTGHVDHLGGVSRHAQTYCPRGTVQDVSYPICQSSQLGGQWGRQCRQGYFCSQGRCCGYASAFGDIHRTDSHARLW